MDTAQQIGKLEALLARVRKNRDDRGQRTASRKRLPSTPLELAVESAELPLPSEPPPAFHPAAPAFQAAPKFEAAPTFEATPSPTRSNANDEYDVFIDEAEDEEMDLPTIPPPASAAALEAAATAPMRAEPAAPTRAEPAQPAAPMRAEPAAPTRAEPAAPTRAEPAAESRPLRRKSSFPEMLPPDAVVGTGISLDAPDQPPLPEPPAEPARALVTPETVAADAPQASAPVARVVRPAAAMEPETFGLLLERSLGLRPH